MKSTSGLGLGLCAVFGCLVVALVAEIYYLLWWKKKKKKIIISKIEEQNGIEIPEKRSKLFGIWERPSSSLAEALCNSPTHVHDPQSSTSNNKDLWIKRPFAEENMGSFPRFLFTITEETREDLESEDGGACKKTRSNLSDHTPFLTPLASPPYFTPPLTPSPLSRYQHERAREEDFNKLKASPPPVFKFLRDAEEKMVQRRMMLLGEEDQQNGEDDENGQFITLVIDDDQQQRDRICITTNLEDKEECFSSRSSSQR